MASGFALRRNGSCLATEKECGPTHPPYHACCPSGSFCPHQYNVDCCPTEANCTIALLPDPQCANAGWDLFDNNGYFCCLRGLAGYAKPGNSNGCAEAGYKFAEGEQLLRTISTGRSTALATSTLSPRSTMSSSQSPSKTKPAETPSSPAPTVAAAAAKTGAVVGGSVGGVLAILLLALAAWFLVVRRRRRQHEFNHSEGARLAEADHANIVHEKDSKGHVLELPAKIAHEKDSTDYISELPNAGPVAMSLNQSEHGVHELPVMPLGRV